MQDKAIKKILFISPLPPPEFGSALSSQSCLEVLSQNSDYEVVNIKLNGAKSINDLNKFSIYKMCLAFYIIIKSLYLVATYKPNLIYIMPSTHGVSFIRDFGLSILIKIFNPNILFHIRTRIIQPSLFSNFIISKAFSGCSAIILGEELIPDVENYFESNKIYILPNAIKRTISDDQYLQIRENRSARNKINVLFISNMIKSKGWDKALHVAKALHQNNFDFKMTFAGSWLNENDKIMFEKFITENDLSQKVFHVGVVNEIQKHSLFTQSDIMLFPTEYKLETFGRVIIEAMEYGIPTISNPICTIPSIIINTETGFLTPSNSIEEIIKCIYSISNDRTYMSRMGDNARKRFLSHYTLETFSPSFYNIINSN